MSTGEELYLLFLTGNRCRTSHSCERRWNLCKELMSDRVSRRLVHSLCACCVFVCESQGSSDLEQNEELFNTYDDSLLRCHLSESWWDDGHVAVYVEDSFGYICWLYDIHRIVPRLLSFVCVVVILHQKNGMVNTHTHKHYNKIKKKIELV